MTTLKIGDKAPELNIPNQNGENLSLANYAGKKLVIYFYPKDMTPGCTAESCDLRDNYNVGFLTVDDENFGSVKNFAIKLLNYFINMTCYGLLVELDVQV